MMKVLMVNTPTTQRSIRSRKGVLPLDLSVATYVEAGLSGRIHIDVVDEDVEDLRLNALATTTLVLLDELLDNRSPMPKPPTTAPRRCLRGSSDKLPENIIRNQACVGFVVVDDDPIPAGAEDAARLLG